METEDEVIRIQQQRAEAEQMVYEYCREVVRLRPLSSEADKKHQAEVNKAKEEPNRNLFATVQCLEEIAQNNKPFRVAIGQIKLSIRGLRHFHENLYPQPVKESLYRHTGGPRPVVPSKDRLEAFTDQWVGHEPNELIY